MKTARNKLMMKKRLTAEDMIKLASQIRRESRKNLNLPEDFDVVKFIHKNR